MKIMKTTVDNKQHNPHLSFWFCFLEKHSDKDMADTQTQTLPLQLIAVRALSLCMHAARVGVSVCDKTSHLEYKTQKYIPEVTC